MVRYSPLLLLSLGFLLFGICHAQGPLKKCIEDNAKLTAAKIENTEGACFAAFDGNQQWCKLTVDGYDPSFACLSNECPGATAVAECTDLVQTLTTQRCNYECKVQDGSAGPAGSGCNMPTCGDEEDTAGSGDSSDSGLTTEAILGIVLGSAAFLCFLMFVCTSSNRASKRAERSKDFAARHRKHSPSVGSLFRREVRRTGKRGKGGKRPKPIGRMISDITEHPEKMEVQPTPTRWRSGSGPGDGDSRDFGREASVELTTI